MFTSFLKIKGKTMKQCNAITVTLMMIIINDEKTGDYCIIKSCKKRSESLSIGKTI